MKMHLLTDTFHIYIYYVCERRYFMQIFINLVERLNSPVYSVFYYGCTSAFVVFDLVFQYLSKT